MADDTPFLLVPWYERPDVSEPLRTHRLMCAGPDGSGGISSKMLSVEQIFSLISGADVKPFADPLTKRETKTANYSATVDDNGKILAFTVTGKTLTMPLASTAVAAADGYMLVVSAQVGSLTISRSGTTDTIVGAASIGLTQGETAILFPDATGTGWRAMIAQPYNTVARKDVANAFTQRQDWAKGTNIASGTSIALPTNGNFFDVTGTATITAIGTVTQAGTRILLRAMGASTLQHNATSLILPTGANLALAVGDMVELVSLGSGNYVVSNVTKADGTPLVAATDTKAWVNFNGTGTVAIRASENVSSITDNGTGDYFVNFANALADANYAVAVNGANTATTVSRTPAVSSRSTSGFRITTTVTSSGAAADIEYVDAIIAR